MQLADSIHERAAGPAAPLRRHLAVIAFVMTCLLVYGSFVPMEFRSLTWNAAVEHFTKPAFLKLGTFKRTDFVANLVLFIPLGFFWLGAIDLDRHRRWAVFIAAPIIAVGLAALSTAVEFLQQWTLQRTPSHHDIVAESIGGIIGLLLWMLLGRRLMTLVRAVLAPPQPVATQREQITSMVLRLRRFLLLYAIGFVLYNTQPLDFAFSPASLRQKAAEGRILLTPFASLTHGDLFNACWQVGGDVLLFLPLGILFRLGPRGPRSLLAASAFAFLAACGVELAQLFIYSRFFDTTDLFIGAAGGMIGAFVGGQLIAAGPDMRNESGSPSSSRIVLAMVSCVLYTIPLLLLSWQPFNWVSSSDQFWHHLQVAINLPFSGHYVGTEFNALTKAVRDVMYFTPYGLLCRWAWGPTAVGVVWGRVLVTLTGLLVGVTIETGQAATVDRFADVTSVMLNIFGALLGWWVLGLIVRKPPLITRAADDSASRAGTAAPEARRGTRSTS